MNALAYEPNLVTNNFAFRMESRNVQELLLSIGFPQHVYGYDYILYSLELISQNPGILHHITKELYPEVAKHFGTKPARVERAIRTAIQITWLYGNMQIINIIFGNTIRPDKGVPTNTQLLAGLYFFLKERCRIYA